MMPVHGFGPACSCGCKRPARELSGLATACFMALTSRERHRLQWEAQNTQPADPLEVAYLLPARPGRWAA